MKKTILFSIACCLFAAFSFCQAQDNLKLKEYYNLPYVEESQVANDSLRRLNLVIPKTETPAPLLIWIGGGAWAYGDKDQEMDLARNLGRQGIAVASVGHRLSPAVWRDPSLNTGIQHPKHVEDIASAVKWLLQHTSQYGYDPEKLFIGGFSSGGHLAALICMDDKYLIKEGLSADIFKGVIPISGAYDIVDYYEVFLNGQRPELAELHVKAVFGETEEDLIEASPTTYLKHLSTPMLLMCDNDLYNYTRLFEDRIRATDFRNIRVVYAYNFSHSGLWRDLSSGEESFYRNTIIDFVLRQSYSNLE